MKKISPKLYNYFCRLKEKTQVHFLFVFAGDTILNLCRRVTYQNEERSFIIGIKREKHNAAVNIADAIVRMCSLFNSNIKNLMLEMGKIQTEFAADCNKALEYSNREDKKQIVLEQASYDKNLKDLEKIFKVLRLVRL